MKLFSSRFKMNKQSKRRLGVLIVLGLSLFLSMPLMAAPKGIMKAPSWQGTEWIQLPEGKTTLDVSDYQGKVVYLYFFQKW